MQKRCCRLAWTEEKKFVTDTNRPAKRWLGALSAAPRSGEISPKNYRPCPEYQSRHHCDENERPAPSACRARGAASGRWRRASKPVLSHILSRPAFATSTARSPSGGHGGGVHVFRIEIPYRLTGYGMSGIGAQEAYNRAGRGSAYWGNAEACVRLQRSAYGRRLARQVTL